MKVLQFICSTGFYGAERWVLALAKHLPRHVTSELVVTLEPGTEELELVKQFGAIGHTHAIPMKGRFDLSAVNKLENKKVLVVDDVVTTGATIFSVEKELRRIGCFSLEFWAIARGK